MSEERRKRERETRAERRLMQERPRIKGGDENEVLTREGDYELNDGAPREMRESSFQGKGSEGWAGGRVGRAG